MPPELSLKPSLIPVTYFDHYDSFYHFVGIMFWVCVLNIGNILSQSYHLCWFVFPKYRKPFEAQHAFYSTCPLLWSPTPTATPRRHDHGPKNATSLSRRTRPTQTKSHTPGTTTRTFRSLRVGPPGVTHYEPSFPTSTF